MMHNPPHPGEVLREWLTDISADMDLRLSKALRTTPGSWYGMQADYDLRQAKRRFRAKVQRITSTHRA
jgi:plasmid maintenance system antidote protein VapI